MNEPASIALARIRIVFELDHADYPRLYDDLVRFKKGTKRVNRLRTLAQEGLVAEHLPLGYCVSTRDAPPSEAGAAATISQVFEQPLTE